MKRTIKVKLSEQSIKAAVKELKDYNRELKTNVKTLVEMLTASGYDVMLSWTNNIEWSGNFKKGRGYEVKVSKGGCSGKIFVKDDSAVFLEFGYGVKGAETGYDGDKNLMTSIGYSYMDGSLDSTLYKENIGLYLTEEKTNNVIGVDEKTGLYIAKTSGQESRSYMYMASKYMRMQLEDIINHVFYNSDYDPELWF